MREEDALSSLVHNNKFYGIRSKNQELFWFVFVFVSFFLLCLRCDSNLWCWVVSLLCPLRISVFLHTQSSSNAHESLFLYHPQFDQRMSWTYDVNMPINTIDWSMTWTVRVKGRREFTSFSSEVNRTRECAFTFAPRMICIDIELSIILSGSD